MATNAKDITLKLVVDGFSKKVIYAEVKKDFVDFFSALGKMPICSIVSLLVENEHQVGRMLQCISDMTTNDTRNSNDPPLFLQECASTGRTPTRCCFRSGRQTQPCEACGHTCETAAPVPTEAEDNCAYMVTDDLVVSPMSSTSVRDLFKNLGIKDRSLVEEYMFKIEVTVDFKKGSDLIDASMVMSKTALTDVFILK